MHVICYSKCWGCFDAWVICSDKQVLLVPMEAWQARYRHCLYCLMKLSDMYWIHLERDGVLVLSPRCPEIIVRHRPYFLYFQFKGWASWQLVRPVVHLVMLVLRILFIVHELRNACVVRLSYVRFFRLTDTFAVVPCILNSYYILSRRTGNSELLALL